MRQTVGLGRAERIESIEISWPTTEKTQILSDVDMDQTIEIVEGRDGYERLKLHRFSLGSE